jgi:hypothetical protein
MTLQRTSFEDTLAQVLPEVTPQQRAAIVAHVFAVQP